MNKTPNAKRAQILHLLGDVTFSDGVLQADITERESRECGKA
jgi:hypothetical protein